MKQSQNRRRLLSTWLPEWHVSCALLAALHVGCKSVPGPAAAPSARVGSTTLGAPKIEPGVLRAERLLQQIPDDVKHLGGGPLAIVASSMVHEGERMGAFVDVPREACLVAYARAASSLDDIDLAAFADDGSPLALDDGPDAKPAIVLCPPHPERMYVATHAATGEGLCVIGAQLVPRERSAAAATVIGARSFARVATKAVEAWPGLEEKVQQHRAGLGANATWGNERRVAVAVDPQAPAMAAIAVPAGGCLDGLIVPDDDVNGLSVEVVDESARVIARAKESGPSRSVLLCSDVRVQGALRIRPHAGRGLVAVATADSMRIDRQALGDQAVLVWSATTESVDSRRDRLNDTRSKEGYGPALASYKGQLALNHRATFDVDRTRVASCTRIDVVAGAPLSFLDAAAWDESGELLASAEASSDLTLFACGHGKARIDLGARASAGPFALTTRPELWNEPVFARYPLAAGRMLATFGRSSTGRVIASRSAVPMAIDASRKKLNEIHMNPGECVSASVGVQGAGSGVDIRIIDVASGEQIDRDAGSASAHVHACAMAEARRMRLEVQSLSGALQAVVGLRSYPASDDP